MNTLLLLVLSNIAVACVLAALAYAAGLWLRRPALTHGLWLLVFLKLITPPLVSVPVIRTAAPVQVAVVAPANPAPAVAQVNPAPAPEQQPIVIVDAPAPINEPPLVAEKPAPAPVEKPMPVDLAPLPVVLPAQEPGDVIPVAVIPPMSVSPMDWSWLPGALGWNWLGGTSAWLLLAAVRVIRFHRLLHYGRPASPELRGWAKDVARRLHVSCPRLVLVPGTLSPMLWVFGWKPRLVLPTSLVDRLTPDQWRTLLAHELAHWKRRDHWVRWLELSALGLYWWCPLVWWARRELQQAEEECCDAWVVSTLPEAARDYALALVETVDFLSGSRTVLPPAASGLGHIHLLRRRLTMILRGRTPRALTLTGLLAVLTLGLVLLPLVPTWAQDAAAPAAVPLAVAVPQKEVVGDKEDKNGKTDAEKARQDLQKLQEELGKMQRQMDQKRRELEEKLQAEFGEKQKDLMKRMQQAMEKAGFPNAGFGGIGGVVIGQPGQAGQPGLIPLPVPGQPGQPGVIGPAGGLILPPGGFPGAGRPDLERRLDELERKLDRLIDRLGSGKGPANAPPPSRNGAGAPPPPPGANPAPPPAAPVREPAKN